MLAAGEQSIISNDSGNITGNFEDDKALVLRTATKLLEPLAARAGPAFHAWLFQSNDGFDRGNDLLTCFDFSPDGRLAVFFDSLDNTLALWDLVRDRRVPLPLPEEFYPEQVGFSPLDPNTFFVTDAEDLLVFDLHPGTVEGSITPEEFAAALQRLSSGRFREREDGSRRLKAGGSATLALLKTTSTPDDPRGGRAAGRDPRFHRSHPCARHHPAHDGFFPTPLHHDPVRAPLRRPAGRHPLRRGDALPPPRRRHRNPRLRQNPQPARLPRPLPRRPPRRHRQRQRHRQRVPAGVSGEPPGLTASCRGWHADAMLSPCSPPLKSAPSAVSSRDGHAEYYPLTLNSLVAACNQRTDDPVMDIGETVLEPALESLRLQHRLVLFVREAGGRQANTATTCRSGCRSRARKSRCCAS
ncbi:MAG: DUF480 domain-containing protein [Kiritimatiellia bacterium]